MGRTPHQLNPVDAGMPSHESILDLLENVMGALKSVADIPQSATDSLENIANALERVLGELKSVGRWRSCMQHTQTQNSLLRAPEAFSNPLANLIDDGWLCCSNVENDPARRHLLCSPGGDNNYLKMCFPLQK